MKHEMKIDKGYRPIIEALNQFREDVKKSGIAAPLAICVEYNDGFNHIYELDIYKDGTGHEKQNYRIVERLVKALLWVVGGHKVYIAGSTEMAEMLKASYCKGGAREFDADFMERVYEAPFEIIGCDRSQLPAHKPRSLAAGGHLKGCRIGFDAGGSDRKVSAVVDGEVIYSEEVVWYPKLQTNPDYHREEILTAMKTAASKMPRVDAIGVSSAGIYINNRIMVASLFVKVPRDVFDQKVKNMYIDIAEEIGAPLEVANDGDVTALAGYLTEGTTDILGIAMGTSEAVGYVNAKGQLNGWLSELAFVPVDMSEDAMEDEWSGDIGCGVKYFSQDSVNKLAELAGFRFEEGLSPAEKLKVIQKRMAEDDEMAQNIYHDIGVYLGYALPFYAEFYEIKHVMLLGRVTSGKGGDLVLETAQKVLQDLGYGDIKLGMPSEKMRRVGQSIAAASLPDIGE